MKQYRTFQHEHKRLQAVRIAHLIQEKPVTWHKSTGKRDGYDNYLSTTQWGNLSPFCLLKGKIWKVYFLNPADLGRWGGEFLPWHIGLYHSSRMIPAEVILTACSDEDVDARLREALSIKRGKYAAVGQVEVLSWFGYATPQKTRRDAILGEPELLWGPFHVLGNLKTILPLFRQVALVFVQHQSIQILTDIRRFFKGLDVLTLPHAGTKWTPLLCGLLKGNIDGFVLMGRNADRLPEEAEELSAFLAYRSSRQRTCAFWRSASPVALYFGETASGDVIGKNLAVLPTLNLPVT